MWVVVALAPEMREAAAAVLLRVAVQARPALPLVVTVMVPKRRLAARVVVVAAPVLPSARRPRRVMPEPVDL